MNISKCKCGGNTIIRQDHFSVSYSDWKIFCEKCGMQTGWTKNKEDAIEIWNRVMDAADINVGHKFDKDINVPNKGFWKPVYESEATGFDPSLAGCDPVFNHVCSVCGQETWANDFGEEYLSDFCPNCGADMRGEDEGLDKQK